ncbi:uncharacterized protein LOC113511598 isoform X1 [Galleria mellonella]|uniref:Uncharacterized protein LOC113511598 isoform X1 n=1 Tax=Galleria mellonella TaxID=7137 RepID=A0A6J3CCS9_GALME|nr:uncharacterized protein LOC113511598 isoform X1 [Galleria mellonella]
MDTKTTISTNEWHIPRPSLSGSSATGSSISDSRSRGGSASSQGSSSNHSTHSVSSGSFLLNAAYLARMQGNSIQEEYGCYNSKLNNYICKTDRSPAVVTIPEERDQADSFWTGVKRGSANGQDATSVASSTHFTVVNGFTKQRPGKEPKSCCCDHSHQITVLVISMTILFSACILAAICFVEMRMRKETGIYKYS